MEDITEPWRFGSWVWNNIPENVESFPAPQPFVIRKKLKDEVVAATGYKNICVTMHSDSSKDFASYYNDYMFQLFENPNIERPYHILFDTNLYAEYATI